MPIVRINGQLHYFAHVPKCGGTAVETYMANRFGPLGFADMDLRAIPAHKRWSAHVPNHIPLWALDRLVPPDWFASSFATVRHPLRRLVSAFFFWRDYKRQIPLGADFNDWFLDAADRIDGNPFLFGGHLLPQTELVPRTARCFRLEDGLDAVIQHLDTLAGESGGPRQMPVVNVGRWRADEAAPQPSAATLDRLARLYADDFARFGYEPPASVASAGALPDLPTLAATGAPPNARARTLTQRFLRSLKARVEPK
jgi:hypothetical protein